ncbi:ABC transporter permease [Speluncibacter jeojiensis]|uniref:ABC transporter permease n=1 Tax=Speluncibacter jeojiensis TaxID=2710754 RepID=A0A9X4RDM6_9ACTN|nr:ABC transporter permease [Corynebacteriales bacterium D3-21]
MNVIVLVARREFTARLRTRAFLISNIVIVAAVVVGLVLASALSGSSTTAATNVGLVGPASSLSATLTHTGEAAGVPIDPIDLPDEARAKADVQSGSVDAALVPDGHEHYRVLTKTSLDEKVAGVLGAAVKQQALANVLVAQGVDPAQLAVATSAAGITVTSLTPPDPQKGQRIGLAYTAVVLLYATLLMFGMYVAMGVVEEKANRVVELLLSTIRPLELLWGKVIGIGLVGLAQLALIGAVAVITATATGLITIGGTAVAVFGSALGWYVLGFVFFAVLYAAAASMVSRQEDLNSTTMPLTLLVIAMFAVAQACVQHPDGDLSNTLSWIPPFSTVLMPIRIAAGVTGTAQIVGTIALMLVACLAMSLLAARIYRRSILQTGTKVSWRDALARS